MKLNKKGFYPYRYNDNLELVYKCKYTKEESLVYLLDKNEALIEEGQPLSIKDYFDILFNNKINCLLDNTPIIKPLINNIQSFLEAPVLLPNIITDSAFKFDVGSVVPWLNQKDKLLIKDHLENDIGFAYKLDLLQDKGLFSVIRLLPNKHALNAFKTIFLKPCRLVLCGEYIVRGDYKIILTKPLYLKFETYE